MRVPVPDSLVRGVRRRGGAVAAASRFAVACVAALLMMPAAPAQQAGTGGSPADVAAILKERYGASVKEIVVVGPVIGAHSGPGTLALFFLGEHR